MREQDAFSYHAWGARNTRETAANTRAAGDGRMETVNLPGGIGRRVEADAPKKVAPHPGG